MGSRNGLALLSDSIILIEHSLFPTYYGRTADAVCWLWNTMIAGDTTSFDSHKDAGWAAAAAMWSLGTV